MTTFSKEADFERVVIHELTQRGWESEILKNPTEDDLLDNWATILFENNRGIDRLNGVPLTAGEIQQIMEQITELRTPLKLNGFINGKTVAITRDNSEDTLHYGKEVSLKIYDRHEIAAGQSRYQIVQQPPFARGSQILNDRRGDLLLLINGMPVIHIELKRSGVPVSQAYNQIQTYSREGLFSGLFSLVQIFVAMEPAEALYFANPGPDGKFNKDYAFHWADFNNEPINDWKAFISGLLSIPMAHQLIGFYTVADESDGVLKVMRSYQYYAAHAISDKVAKTDWKNPNRLGGYIWHTTGSGKTMTSFKSAQLIANSKDADKVIFLLDRIELGTQTLEAYRNFAGDNNDVQATEHTGILVNKLKSTNPADTLIVTSIQKMSRLKDEEDGLKAHDLAKIRSQRIVFIIDECHRSTFGDMLTDIKNSFAGAVFFGFSGTPIQIENVKKENTTTDVFGNELHRYSIADGIRDKNVLGFDPYKVMTYRDRDLRQAVALEKAKAASPQEAFADPKKKKVFNHYMTEVTMAGYRDNSGVYVKGIEDHLPNTQYERDEHQNAVIQDIADNWITLSQGSKFHAIFATSSIREAITYYRLMKAQCPELKTTALFDPNIDNDSDSDPAFKTDGLVEILMDYNQRYGQNFDLGSHGKFKKDIANRLAHKKPYTRIETEPDKQIDLLIVVDQMLTGFDSKWVNTLYLDKVLKYENIIQAFSRTNRLFGPDKPFGTIRYYRKPHTMERNIKAAVKLYSGDREISLFVNRLPANLNRMNACFAEISAIFDAAGIEDFKKLPDDLAERGAFAKHFKEFSCILEAAKIQSFTWEQAVYEFGEAPKTTVTLSITHQQYLTLLQRYKELGGGGGEGSDAIPFEIDSHITEIDTDKIDADYMNSRFEKYLKVLEGGDNKAKETTLAELHRSFASLSQEEQKFAEIFLRDIHRGDVQIDSTRTFRDYLTDYQAKAQNEEVETLVQILGIDAEKLRALMNTNATDANLNEYGRFDELKGTIDKQKAKAYFEATTGEKISPAKVNIRADNLLRKFILEGGFELEGSDSKEPDSLGGEEKADSASENSSQIKFKEHQLVSLVKAVPAEGLSEGAVGTIVHIYADGRACEVEFIVSTGSKVITLLLNQIKHSK
ncbi:type I restriction endonuclease subunit R, EcoR124 family [Gimesia chilikensis]|uniref:type I restriction endonuclease subunit R, EcoR124 family n=1 Tax=Gimesia chilikensis TaxID=2605989 RepID=UPI00118D0A93|nr:HsdR family type I site-specific deoxyribonuclease [Gimesia chilikensis]QDT82453.1 Type-1 restriction enzyme R protein [Gimesia chilikensis]